MPMSVITVAGINPILNILGAAQQFNYTQQLSALQITNSFIPSVGIPSLFDMEYRNNMLSGFRWTHTTTDTDTHGSLTLQSFVNAQSTGIDIMTFSESNNFVILSELDLNNNKIINLATPTLPTDAATKAYADSVTSGLVTLVSDITGSGNVGTNITTTFKQNPIFLGTDSLTIPLGTTAQQPGSPTIGMIRYNTTINNIEIYNNSVWLSMGTGDGTVTSITAGTGLDGGVITTAGTIDLANTAVTPGSYTNGDFTVNAQGQLTAASSGGGSGTVTSITAGTGLSGGVITTAGTIDLANTAVTPGSYTNGSFTVNAQGQLTAASSNLSGVVASLHMENNAVSTNLPVALTFVKASGVTTSAFLTSFTMPVDNRLLYTGTQTITCLVSVSTSSFTTDNSVDVGVAIYKNGSVVLAPIHHHFSSSGDEANIANIAPVQFSTNDYIEVFVNADSTTTLTVADLNIVISL